MIRRLSRLWAELRTHPPATRPLIIEDEPPRVTLDDVIEGVATLTLKPGDILVLRHPRILSVEAMHRLATDVQRHLPADVKVLVLEDGMTVARITREKVLDTSPRDVRTMAT